jgi:uncharacterized damage-inducible protein DinB
VIKSIRAREVTTSPNFKNLYERTVRPNADEYNAYYGKYIALVPDDEMDVVHHLADQHLEYVGALRKAKQKGDHAYAPGKWTVKEVIGHICDSERVFAYRALRFARGDTTDLAGFEQDDYVKTAESNRRTMDDLIEELWAVRAATLSLAKHLSPEALRRGGKASGYPVTVRALLYIIAGHERHHMAILNERYGV